ncbi:methylmalonyl-CoA mutase [Thermaerobacter marianensis DSM 12885]|uniref:methylmalonyl-CoA mutase n=1 Tax=Thermaerobacter marianensis (strain ATCC 700841 / DSM 12885 / JCM 10246 / 7p75a) TaxID=644966 RepID=E6SLS2_THEM7|nr:methylmalonyl-CoA mutase family protein [Thermaerobacter marianensis]ADU51371.1 methylmalonyl-CoA mutase [Thermaerobacter marianensis DSM 12885]
MATESAGRAGPARERRPRFQTLSGIEVKRCYGPEDVPDAGSDRRLGRPGEWPYTRGIHETMYRGRLWTMRQFAGFGTAEQTNRRFKYLLKEGQTGLSVAFDFPTLLGYDSDHPMSDGEVGKLGVAIDTLADMEILFDGIPLDQVSTSMTINGPAAMIFAMYLAAAEKQGVSLDRLRGTIQNDILKEYIAQNTYIFPPRPSMRIITDIFAFCADHVPQWNTVSISGYHIREAGATAVQELAFTLANGFEYVRAGIEAGLDVDRFAPRLSFFFNVHNDFFEEIAKLRAARRIWATDMREKFGAKDPRSWKMRFHCQTAGCTLTAQQPEINIVRVTLQALAAVLGGTQSLHTNSFDEALALPTEKAVRIALRTQQIIAEESGVTHTVDPLGGSYYVEWLTDEMERRAREYFRRIDELGGVIPAIEAGFFQKEIADASYRYQQQVESGEVTVVGVNRYVLEEEEQPEILRVPDEVQQRQVQRLRDIRRTRDNRRVRQALRDLRAAARSGENLMPRLLECARAYATLGEMCDTLREVFGEYRDRAIF